MKRRYVLFATAVSLSCLTGVSYAADKQAANVTEKQSEVAINQEIIEKNLACYREDLQDLVIKAECRIKKIEASLSPADYREAAQKLLEKGDALNAEGKADDAVKTWQEALSLSNDPSIQKAVEERAKKLEEERAAKAAEEKALAAQAAEKLAAEQRAAEAAAEEEAMQEKAAKEKEAAPPVQEKALDESWHKKTENKPEPPKELGIGDIIEKRK